METQCYDLLTGKSKTFAILNRLCKQLALESEKGYIDEDNFIRIFQRICELSTHAKNVAEKKMLLHSEPLRVCTRYLQSL